MGARSGEYDTVGFRELRKQLEGRTRVNRSRTVNPAPCCEADAWLANVEGTHTVVMCSAGADTDVLASAGHPFL